MSLFIIILLVLFFGYAIALVLANNSEIAVNLLFSQVPTTNLGLLLVLTIALGVFIGILLSVLLFRVLQNKLEIRRLRKEKADLQTKLDEANVVIEHSRQSHILADETKVTVPEQTITTIESDTRSLSDTRPL
ncbi:LapA family protein [Moraxella bovis]|uniref:LapA family protein n=1 Tax=Moraxella bovis TaxID=476 RepID=A0AAQ2QAL8_MORBO|nr:LapA family protein [Moraxella bovis]OOR88834.1 hypothetical protein B0182_09005 [Moraxella bovis]UYZ69482.1 LapA family protein [Moraxella bovis]UYZ71853.1 LapA family protein [Moraxella bovis]UYZ72233.1 LapA family protein [Moraxella bovis]UYZ76762.1 LapA family protein [Moraxella bovis]